jgi:nitrate/TMAO reductase-like tetraheme cytochrome c subunit
MVTRRTKRVLLVVSVVAPIVLAGAAFIAAEATKGNEFCGTACHEMRPYYRTWQGSEHADVDCVECHIPHGIVNYAKTKAFALREVWVHFTEEDIAPIAVTRHIPNDTCAGCHDPSEMEEALPLAEWTRRFRHEGHAEVPACIECHAQVVHAPIAGIPYSPARAMESCFECHDGETQPDDCDYCHGAPHRDRGTCETCHGLRSWDPTVSHEPRLIEPHAEFPCERCHAVVGATEIGEPVGCYDCHEPAHPLKVGELRLRRCAECHTIVRWKPNTFDHPATGCIRCHGNEHGNAQLRQCQDCHSQTTWASAKHQPQLQGAHRSVSCLRCHSVATNASLGDPAGCVGCHRPSHPLALPGLELRRCYGCHRLGGWSPNSFDHPTTGCVGCHGNRHGSSQLTRCQDCHSQTTWAGARHPNTSCLSCHGAGRLHSGIGTQCQTCHVSGRYWVPSTFRHRQVGPHVPAGEHRLSCTQCHATTYAKATCTPCHGPGGPADND